MEIFERDVWPKIIQIVEKRQKTGEPIETTGFKNKNWVLEVKPDEIIVRSEKNERNQPNGEPRPVPKWAIKEVWTILQKNGKMSRKDMLRQVDENKYRRIGSIIRGILALLPNISVKKIGRTPTLFYNAPKMNTTED